MTQILPFEFHISKKARGFYAFDESFFTTDGRIILVNLNAARQFAQKMNEKRDITRHPEQFIHAGEINALGLITEIQHLLLHEYRRGNPLLFSQALTWLRRNIDPVAIEKTLENFISMYPPTPVYRNEISVKDYLDSQFTDADGILTPARQIAVEELLILWLTNENPAVAPLIELFDDSELKDKTLYLQVIAELKGFFNQQPFILPESINLIDFLRAPALAVPGSLIGQLEYIRTHWGVRIQGLLSELLTGIDLIREETKPIYSVGGPGPSEVPVFTRLGVEIEPELERFSQDLDWMPNLVLLAKNAYVWLDQLSKKYNQTIKQLDEIPDAELDFLAKAGITGLWLIGLWERSPASKTIKQMRGNPEAVASAYSLFSYDIAYDLGGEEAFTRFRLNAGKRGIRIASDMVPNHMGIDSRWVIEHPQWFISLDGSPFPSYTFNGTNFSWDPRVGIYIEDHYFNNTDAAVVFKRVDYWTGQEKFIYHGNDGTSMPWNDTAQLNYLIPEVREAVIQTILHVARKTPIIRFDAAMTLAKRHYQRLWFPEPGSGGDIPSRAGLGLSKDQFDIVFPEEFWREVVDRVAQEAPDTLLLAEAFWMMEGYFVRTLGMHRVYNSAFMNMLRDEKNQEYRLVIKNTIEFDPEILKRYVNFMNNPDERTAVDQFGKGDKYFGICTMMATLPGLPMFGHGQLEGYTEKYGMEYKRAFWNEQSDPYLIDRHTKEIFPLLRHRYLFAEVLNFKIYDFITSENNVDEDVFAYSNRSANMQVLVVYHNRYKSTRGWIRDSSAYLEKRGDERVLTRSTFGMALDIPDESNSWVIFRDFRTNLEYIRNCTELNQQGLYLELNAYACFLFQEFRIVQSFPDQPYHELATYLQGGGVLDIDEALQEYLLRPILVPFREIVNSGFLSWLAQNRRQNTESPGKNQQEILNESRTKLNCLFTGISIWLKEKHEVECSSLEIENQAEEAISELNSILSLPVICRKNPQSRLKIYRNMEDYLLKGPNEQISLGSGNLGVWGILLSYWFIQTVKKFVDKCKTFEPDKNLEDRWYLLKTSYLSFRNLGMDDWSARRNVSLLRIFLQWENRNTNNESPKKIAFDWINKNISEPSVQKFLNVNRYDNTLWFNKESFEELTWWLFMVEVINVITKEKSPNYIELLKAYDVIQVLLTALERSEYQVEKLISPESFV